MKDSTLTREMALRIGLAARELDAIDASQLLKVIDELVGLPPSAQQLATLKPGRLKAAAGGLLKEQSSKAIKAACAALAGDLAAADPLLPSVDDYEEGDMPGSIRIACASNGGELVDGHFGSCRYFLIYQVSVAEIRLVDIREVGEPEEGEEKNAYRASLVGDAQVLFVASIGGPAAAKVVRAGIHPIKFPQGGSARDALLGVQARIADAPPPWLAKVMGHEPDDRTRFSSDSLEAEA